LRFLTAVCFLTPTSSSSDSPAGISPAAMAAALRASAAAFSCFCLAVKYRPYFFCSSILSFFSFFLISFSSLMRWISASLAASSAFSRSSSSFLMRSSSAYSRALASCCALIFSAIAAPGPPFLPLAAAGFPAGAFFAVASAFASSVVALGSSAAVG